jgi:hypothetical protein
MHGVTVVRFERRRTLEFHDAADHVALSARRNVFAYVGFEHARDVIFQRTDFTDHAVLLRCGDAGLQSKCEHVNEHGSWSLTLENDGKIVGDGVRSCQ